MNKEGIFSFCQYDHFTNKRQILKKGAIVECELHTVPDWFRVNCVNPCKGKRQKAEESGECSDCPDFTIPDEEYKSCVDPKCQDR